MSGTDHAVASVLARRTGAGGAAPTTVTRARSVLVRRARLVTGTLAVVLAGVFALAMSVGDVQVSAADTVRVLTGRIGEADDFVTWYAIHELRLPRAFAGMLVGMSFGLSGVIFQTLVRNPLASPDIIGIVPGASAAAAFCILMLHWSGSAVSAGALGGALAAAATIYLLAWRRAVSTYRMVLAGIGMAAGMNALVSFLMTRAEVIEAQKALVWITGSLSGSSLESVRTLAAVLAVLIPVALLLARPLRSLQLGDDAARALGTRVELSRLGLVLVAVALAAVAVAAAGPIAFVALMSGPIAHRLLRGSGVGFVAAALVGALVTMLADLIAQNLLGGNPLPVGVVTGAVGAPYLAWLLLRANRSGKGAV
jgi:iron complex transport system permease protein